MRAQEFDEFVNAVLVLHQDGSMKIIFYHGLLGQIFNKNIQIQKQLCKEIKNVDLELQN